MHRQLPKYRPRKKPRLYLDENFPPECISVIFKFDAKHAVLDFGYAKKEDEFHYAFANKDRRILLTLDRDYENDRLFKHNNTFGVIIISVSSPITPERINKVLLKLKGLLSLISIDGLKNKKILATLDGWTVWYIENGKKVREHNSW